VSPPFYVAMQSTKSQQNEVVVTFDNITDIATYLRLCC